MALVLSTTSATRVNLNCSMPKINVSQDKSLPPTHRLFSGWSIDQERRRNDRFSFIISLAGKSEWNQSEVEKKRGEGSGGGHGKLEDVVVEDGFGEGESEEGSPGKSSGVGAVAPLVSALKSFAERNVAGFDFPGHNRGNAAPRMLTDLIGVRPFIHDLQELDNLFSPVGPILEAQTMAARLFGASKTWFLVCGTTCGVQAAIMATCSPGDYIILPRNCHVSALSAMVLCGAIPKYIVPDHDSRWDIPYNISSEQVARAMDELQAQGHKLAAVFMTSPTYHGICSHVSEISELCHTRHASVPLIVDEAHGAHLGFNPRMLHSALQQGADLVVQSTHKVLSSLTQSSMLHMSGDIVSREKVSLCLQTLQSTSHSVLLLASLDAARAQIGENPDNIFTGALELATEMKALIQQIPGIAVLDSSSFSRYCPIDPLRLTIGFWQLGLSGYEAEDILDRDQAVVAELVGTQSMTFAINLGTRREHVHRLVSGLRQLSSDRISLKVPRHMVEKKIDYATFSATEMILSPRDAFFAKKRRVELYQSLGKVCGELICPFPPGIPLLIPGEIITDKALDYLIHIKTEGALVTGASDPNLFSILICHV